VKTKKDYGTFRLGVDAGLMALVAMPVDDLEKFDLTEDSENVFRAKPSYDMEVGSGSVRFYGRDDDDGDLKVPDGHCVVVSDPCYVIDDDRWSEFVARLDDGDQGRFPEFLTLVTSTVIGDGEYDGNWSADDGVLKEATVKFSAEDEDDDYCDDDDE
jgi:hypothetical protein